MSLKKPSFQKLGHYQVGDFKTYSKLKAIEQHASSGIHPHWYFNDAEFGNCNWRKEPKTDILELYRQRAQQLRDRYDYIIVMYSSGGDSQTVFDAFINNGIQLDEVCSMINYKATGSQEGYLNGEIFSRAIPLVKQAQLQQPQLQHRILDISDAVLNWHQFENDVDWVYDINSMYGPNNIIRRRLDQHVPEWQARHDQGQSICIVYGCDRPRVVHQQGHYFFQFLDIQVANSAMTNANLSIVNELFFWTPDMPEICIKQAHMIRQYLESQADPAELPYVSANGSGSCYREINGIKYWLSREGVDRLVYPQLGSDVIKPTPSASMIFGFRDEWFWRQANTDAYDRWIKGIDYLIKQTPDYWLKDVDHPEQGLKGCVSRPYLIG